MHLTFALAGLMMLVAGAGSTANQGTVRMRERLPTDQVERAWKGARAGTGVRIP